MGGCFVVLKFEGGARNMRYPRELGAFLLISSFLFIFSASYLSSFPHPGHHHPPTRFLPLLCHPSPLLSLPSSKTLYTVLQSQWYRKLNGASFRWKGTNKHWFIDTNLFCLLSSQVIVFVTLNINSRPKYCKMICQNCS